MVSKLHVAVTCVVICVVWALISVHGFTWWRGALLTFFTWSLGFVTGKLYQAAFGGGS